MTSPPLGDFESLKFDNLFTQELKADPARGPGNRQVKGAHFSRVLPSVMSQPKLVAYSNLLAKDLGLDPATWDSDTFAMVVSGQTLLPGMDPFAMCYGGHQFGHWAGQLGDGRAINLGEVIDAHGGIQALQLKGSGPTPYSRSADGWAVLRSSVREFLCSEAMHHLGVPTTRALSLALTGDGVMRDMFYDGNAKLEPGAVVCRVAPSFVRFGSFEIFAARGEEAEMRQLAEFVIRHHYPHLLSPNTSTPPEKEKGEEIGKEIYLAWFQEICERTADMIVHWSRVGFVHGVMNTDNLSILGLTIDYGPYGWLEDYDPNWTPNTTDASGKRYAFGNQSQIGLWNLLMLANAIVPLIEDVEALQAALGTYTERYDRGWEGMMASKMGLGDWVQATDEPLTKELLEILESAETDWTLFFRSLAGIRKSQDQSVDEALAHIRPALYQDAQDTPQYRARMSAWIAAYRIRLDQTSASDAERVEGMNRVNPKYVLRNYLAQLAIDDAEKGDYDRIQELLTTLRNPYEEQEGRDHLAEKRPEWARSRAGCSMLSCSS